MKQKTKEPGTEYSQYFFDSEKAEVNDLSELIAKSLLFLADLYNPEVQTPKIFDAQNKLEEVIRDLLLKESETRIFDRLFMGQIHPQGNKVAIIAKLISSFLNNNTIVKEVSPAATVLEAEIIQRVGSWFGYDQESVGGNVVSGGTTANLEALWIAREKAKVKGKSGPYIILATEMAHYSIAKAAELLGSDVKIVVLPTKNFVCDVEKSKKLIKSLKKKKRSGSIISLVGLAGETETGLIDDLQSLSELSLENDIHFHVDAAYGGPYILSKAKKRFVGINQADSITIDPHKMLYVPYNAGMVLLKDKSDLVYVDAVMKSKARYLLDSSEGEIAINLADRNHGMSRIEGSMGSEATVATWATLQLFEEDGLESILNHTLDMTALAHSLVLESKNLRPLFQPELNTLLIGLKDTSLSNQKYNSIIQEVQHEADSMGYYFSVNNEVDESRAAFRMVVMHPHTSQKNVQEIINVFDGLVSKYINKGKND